MSNYYSGHNSKHLQMTNVIKNLKIVSGKKENIVVKGENAAQPIPTQ